MQHVVQASKFAPSSKNGVYMYFASDAMVSVFSLFVTRLAYLRLVVITEVFCYVAACNRLVLGYFTPKDIGNSLRRNVGMRYAVTQRHIQEQRNPQLHRCENLKTDFFF